MFVRHIFGGVGSAIMRKYQSEGYTNIVTGDFSGFGVEYEMPLRPALKLDEVNGNFSNFSEIMVKRVINNFNWFVQSFFGKVNRFVTGIKNFEKLGAKLSGTW